MAPEQLHASGGLGYLGTAVDVWASGIMLLVMLVRGRSRWQGMTLQRAVSCCSRADTCVDAIYGTVETGVDGDTDGLSSLAEFQQAVKPPSPVSYAANNACAPCPAARHLPFRQRGARGRGQRRGAPRAVAPADRALVEQQAAHPDDGRAGAPCA